MRAFRSVTSIRIGVGFGIVLAVFGTTVGLALRRFHQVQELNREIEERQQTREMALRLGHHAQNLFFLQLDFVSTRNYRNLGEVLGVLEDIKFLTHELHTRSADRIEKGWIHELRIQAENLRNLCYNEINEAVVKEDTQRIQRALDQSRQVLLIINELNDRLGRSLEGKIWDAHQSSLEAWDSSKAETRVLLAVGVIVSVVVIALTRRSIVRPIQDLAAGTEVVAAGNLDRAIQVKGGDEFAHLGRSFNEMTRRLRVNQDQLLRAEKMASIGQLAAGVAHEINNPITVILGYTKMLLSSVEEGSDEYQDIKTIQEEAVQCKNIVEQLLDLARPVKTNPEVVDVVELTDEILAMAQKLGLTKGVEIDKKIKAGPLLLAVDRARMRQVALNVVVNALEAMRDSQKKSLHIGAVLQTGPHVPVGGADATRGLPMDEPFLVVSFSDSGPGLSAEAQRRIFEPFYTTKAHGTGLGLAISYGIIRAHGGSIDVESDGVSGSTFHVSLRVVEHSGDESSAENYVITAESTEDEAAQPSE